MPRYFISGGTVKRVNTTSDSSYEDSLETLRNAIMSSDELGVITEAMKTFNKSVANEMRVKKLLDQGYTELIPESEPEDSDSSVESITVLS